MKRVLVVLVVLMLVGVGSNAYGATLSYDPGSVDMALAPGESASAGVKVLTSGQRAKVIYVNMKGSVTNGNLPIEWVGGKDTGLTSAEGYVDTDLSITVPEGAEAGTYYGIVLPSVKAGRERVKIGGGVYVKVEVASSCQGAPGFIDTTIGPEDISARNHKNVDITVAGTVTVPDGCELAELSFDLDDEYGEFNVSGKVDIADDGSFLITAPVKASRRGSDKDGRLYTITIKAVDALGSEASQGFYVTVGHDSRTKKDKSNNGKALGKENGNGPVNGSSGKANAGQGGAGKAGVGEAGKGEAGKVNNKNK